MVGGFRVARVGEDREGALARRGRGQGRGGAGALLVCGGGLVGGGRLGEGSSGPFGQGRALLLGGHGAGRGGLLGRRLALVRGGIAVGGGRILPGLFLRARRLAAQGRHRGRCGPRGFLLGERAHRVAGGLRRAGGFGPAAVIVRLEGANGLRSAHWLGSARRFGPPIVLGLGSGSVVVCRLRGGLIKRGRLRDPATGL